MCQSCLRHGHKDTANTPQVVAKFIAQLDEIFGTPANPKPASSSLVEGKVFNWANEPWARAAYT